MRHLRLLLAATMLVAPVADAFAQSPNTDTYFYTPGGGGVNGALGMCLNTSNKAVPCSATNVVPSPVTVSPFPVNPATGLSAVPINGNATGSTGAVVGTLAAASSKTTYLCDFDVSALGTANSPGPVVVAGLLGGSKTYQMSALATGVESHILKNFNPCLPASAVNTAITITTTAAAGAIAVDVNSSGYQY